MQGGQFDLLSYYLYTALSDLVPNYFGLRHSHDVIKALEQQTNVELSTLFIPCQVRFL